MGSSLLLTGSSSLADSSQRWSHPPEHPRLTGEEASQVLHARGLSLVGLPVPLTSDLGLMPEEHSEPEPKRPRNLICSASASSWRNWHQLSLRCGGSQSCWALGRSWPGFLQHPPRVRRRSQHFGDRSSPPQPGTAVIPILQTGQQRHTGVKTPAPGVTPSVMFRPVTRPSAVWF